MKPNQEKREQMIERITGLLKTNPFSFEFQVKEKPEGIKIICEITQEEMDVLSSHINNE
jgi:hypothetical protein